ncbi:hypothetical protein PV08_06742 [Exophiala spinifera]|uniref:Uncharacterized protein n=1 Tax=Exophiala spinifera TaxID=91928 RepID=A0A0D1YG09_9EURO|nr:uncharacterized protein PV08_06742 [Exophiala spinifera]KIW13961.1 hypothetical protein PV08_06742 [Exophiala spinifera]
MIPPLSEAALDANPAFARLWSYVTEEILEDDGSRRIVNQERTKEWRRAFAEKSGKRDAARGRARRRRVVAVVGGGSVRRVTDDDQEVQSDSRQEVEIETDVEVDGTDEDEEDEALSGSRDGSLMQNKEKEKKKTKTKTKTKKNDFSLEEMLHETRVEKMRMQVLMDVLRDVAYSDASPLGPGDSAEEEENTTRSCGTTQPHPHPHPHTGTTNATSSGNTNAKAVKDNLLVMTAYMDTERRGSSGHPSRPQHGRYAHHDPSLPQLSRAERELLSEDTAVFRENIPAIAKQVGRRLVEVERGLGEMSRLLSATTNTANTTNTTPAPTSTALVDSLRHCQHYRNLLRSSLSPRLGDLSTALVRLLSLQREQLSGAIRTLEAAKHGTVSRHAHARTAFFATVARAMALKTRLVLLEERSRVENSDAVKAKRAHAREMMSQLDREDRDVTARIEDLKRIVSEYDAVDSQQTAAGDRVEGKGGGGGVMTRLGKRYGEIEEEMDILRSDIEKLQLGQKTRWNGRKPERDT